MPFQAQDYSPGNIVFELEIGGLTNMYKYDGDMATIPMSMELKETTIMGMGTLTFVVFDDTGFDIEPYLWIGRDETRCNVPAGRIRWGYTAQKGENLSEWRDFQLDGYNVAIGKNYFTLTATSILTGVTPLMGCNQYSGTLMECINKFVSIHNYVLEVNPAIDESRIKTMDPSGKTTEMRAARFTKTNEETDLSFIQRLIRDYAVSSDGKVGYTVSFVTEGGINKLKITLPENAPLVAQYVVQAKNSVVVEWNPNISFTGIASMGASQVRINGTHPITGDNHKVALDFQTTQKKGSELGSSAVTPDVRAYPDVGIASTDRQFCSETMEDNVTSQGLRIRKGASFDPITGYSKALSDHLTQALYNNTATLTILGDPYIKPGTQIEILYYYPSSLRFPGAPSRKHYTSGTYFCSEVKHNITNGKYLTMLTLNRFGMSDQPQP